MEHEILQRISEELNAVLVGGFVNKIHQPLPREIVLRVRRGDIGEVRLAVSVHPQLARIHTTNVKIPNPPTPPRFCAFLRAHFQGARITEVSCSHDDRVVTIMAGKGPPANLRCLKLIVEFLGRDSNILLVDSYTNEILDCLHRIPEKEKTTRVVLPGRLYSAPPKRLSFSDVSMREKPSSMSPGIRCLPQRHPGLALNCIEGEDECFPSLNRAADALYGPQIDRLIIENLRRNAVRPLISRIRSVDRRLQKISADVKRLESLAELGHQGELLKANINRATKGLTGLHVSDWDGNTVVNIVLDPALNAVGNMNKLFKKAAKGKRGKTKAQDRLRESLSEKMALQDCLFHLEQTEDLQELENWIGHRIDKPGAQSREKSGHKAILAREGTNFYREFRTESDRRVLVGRSGMGNDFLLRKIAKNGDLWFHVKDQPGAHVLLIIRGEENIEIRDTQFAARLALMYSKAKHSGKAEVIIAKVENVKRPPKGLPGQVLVNEYVSVMASI
jgi:predicted ribosome quality control (RQC) complex YloA/Tae2 family protein